MISEDDFPVSRGKPKLVRDPDLFVTGEPGMNRHFSASALDFAAARERNHDAVLHQSADPMNSSIHRRNFLRKGALAAAGMLCAGSAGALVAADAAQRTAHGFIGKYSDNFIVRSESAGVTRLVALVRDLPSFSEALFRAKAAGISELRVAKTVATFRAGGHTFEVENLMGEDFTALNS